MIFRPLGLRRKVQIAGCLSIADLAETAYRHAMGFRFSRRIKIAPGVRLNLSKSGVSTSVGRKGAWMTFGSKGTRSTVGIPDTGVSYSETKRSGGEAVMLVLVGFALFWIFWLFF